MYEASSKGPDDRRKRERGLKLGVGRFSGGVLKISQDELTSTVRRTSSQRGGRGGKRK